MIVKEHFPRWIQASFAKHFKDGLPGYKVVMEGELPTPHTEAERIEIRVDGPYIRELSKDAFLIFSEVNILIATIPTNEDFYRHATIKGKVANLFTDVPIHKYGKESVDDQSIICYMKLLPLDTFRPKLAISEFGQIDPAIPLLQAVVEGHYEVLIHI